MRVTVHVRGIGGQALPFIVTMLGRRAAEANIHFTSREVFGMAQRGGSIFATLDFETTEAEESVNGTARSVLLGLELLEGYRGFEVLRPGEQAILSTARVIPPGTWRFVQVAYPSIDQVAAAAAQHGIDLTLVETPADAPWLIVQTAIDRGAIPIGTRRS